MIFPLYHTTITGIKVAVLTPSESDKIRGKLNLSYKNLWDYLLYSRMRIAEARYVADHPECFREENRAIFLPRVPGLGKLQCTIKNRAITLPDLGVVAVKRFLDDGGKIPVYMSKGVERIAYQNMDQVIERAARDADFDLSGITTKMLRKTGISWYFACFPEQESMILMSAGHTAAVARGNYITTGFRNADIKEMRIRLKTTVD